jgi:ribonuclease PH
VEEKAPPFLRNTGKGWITAEYSMLPCATHERTDREAAKGKVTGRTQEIQRLIGRALRSVINLSGFGERQIRIDCDVLQADGGTRTAAITGSFIALYGAFLHMKNKGLISELPIKDHVAAISCGLFNGQPVLDLDYSEDSNAQADGNFVLTGRGGIVEIQTTAEQEAFDEHDFSAMLELARDGIDRLVALQKKAISAMEA